MDNKFTFGSQLPNISYTERRAAYVVVTNDDKFAAVESQQKYFLPGGGSFSGESAEDTIIREVFEELARGVQLIRNIGEAIQYFYSAADDRHYKMQAIFFVGEFTGKAHVNGKGENELCWLTKAEAEQRFFHECHKWAIRRIQ